MSLADLVEVTYFDGVTAPTETVSFTSNNDEVAMIVDGVLTPVVGTKGGDVTITATAEYVPGEGYRIDGTRIAVGEAMALRFPDFVCEGYCISVAAENFN